MSMQRKPAHRFTGARRAVASGTAVLVMAIAAVAAVIPAAGATPDPQADPASPAAAPARKASSATASTPAAAGARPVTAVPRSERAEMWRARRFGVDHLRVRSVSSGVSIEFRYRVVDAGKAAILNDKRAQPVLVDRKTGTMLTVPTMEKVGMLRQTATPEVGREYWMLFANTGRVVKPGQRVDVVIGSFRADSLTVE